MTGASHRRIDVAILGATGTVGQRFLQRLEGHPWFRVTSLVASPRSAGKRYADACDWRLDGDVPEYARDLVVTGADQAPAGGVRLALSSLDSSVAGEVETRYADAGVFVVSNASAHRMGDRVPLIVPEVNADHLDLVRAQGRSNGGAIVCNPNCSTIGLVLALAPLHAAFGVQQVAVTTLQAASGAGYPGVPALDLLDNVVPFIPGEEDKLGEEPAKILGTFAGDRIEPAAMTVSAQCFRVAVVDGHSASVALALREPATAAQIVDAWRSFAPRAAADVPSAVKHPIVVTEQRDRPQPRLDRDRGDGMAATVGRLRPCPILGWRFIALSHNTIRGAAGGAILVAEHVVARGLLTP